MKNVKQIILSLFVAVAFVATAQDEAMKNIEPIVSKAAANCDGPIWGDTEADSVKAITNYSLYREDFKMADKAESEETKLKGYKIALKGWKYVFFNAPKARVTTHLNGVEMYKAFYKATDDEALKGAYLDTMLAIYEVREHCFGEDADLSMRKAFEWFNYNKDGNEVFVYEMFNKTIDQFDAQEGTSVNDISPAFLYPWAAITLVANKKNLLSDDDLFNIYERVSNIVDYNIEVGNDAGKYVGALEKVSDLYNKYDVLTCENIIPAAEKKYNEAKDDPDNVVKVYKMLKAGKCYDAPFFLEVVEKVVVSNPSPGLYKFLASKYRKDGNYNKAIEYTNKALELSDNNEEKASLQLQIARDYQSKGDFSSARSNAMKAADLKGGWGQPYLLIGRLYASSGSRCGSGTGWDSQVVTWVAIDEFQKAKNIDPSVASEAQKLINQYSQYMPSKQDVFLRSDINIGDSYTVGCWINRTTTVRVSN